MVKTPKTRHSKSHREPVTIELQPDEVSRVAEEAAPADRPAEEAAGPATDADTDADSDIGGGFDELPPRPRADAADERQEDAVSAGSIPPRTGGPNPILAGLAGALIALAGAGALQYAGVLGAPGASLDAVDSQGAALKTQGAAPAGAGAGGGGMRDKVAVLETTVAELGKSAGVADADLAPLNDRIAALDALAKGSADAASEQQARLGALEQSVMQLATKVEAQASQPKIALSIAASALKATLDRGAPFAAELETFAAIAPDAPQLALLRPYAEKGVATRAEIAAGMDDAANAMVAAATPPDADAGFFQSLMASAERLVKVRPIGAVEGSGVPETVARMEAAVDQGDYAGAIAEYDTLPEAGKAAGAEPAGKLQARLGGGARVGAPGAAAVGGGPR